MGAVWRRTKWGESNESREKTGVITQVAADRTSGKKRFGLGRRRGRLKKNV